MKLAAVFVFSMFSVIPTAVFAQFSENLTRRFTDAESQIVRLPPRSFLLLPVNVVLDLQKRGCMIPQVASSNKQNVIQGQFEKPGQTDWAVLCSLKGVSSILVFWNGSEKNPAVIAQREDRTFLQDISADQISFSRGLSAIGRKLIMRNYLGYGGLKPPPIDHQGIDDAFVGKASVTWYFYLGRWLALPGAD